MSGGTGPRFLRHTGVAAPLSRSDSADGVVDVHALLAREEHQGASFLVAPEDFDAGDAPETAISRLLALGIRAVIAPGFERTFYGACFTHGLLPVILGEGVIAELIERVESDPTAEVTVDLEAEAIECPGMESIAFRTDPRLRNKLLLGLTDLDEMLRYVEDTASLRSTDRKRRPWIYDWR